MGIEAERHLEFQCSLGADTLLIKHMHGTERIGECFEYVLTLFSKDADIEAEDLLGSHATIRVQVGSHPERYFDGIVTEFGCSGFNGRFAQYRAVLRPWFWLLSRSRECRVFQELTTAEIFDKIVKEKWGFSDVEAKLLYQLQPREYCVQYRESDLTFLMRLMEEDGVYFFFLHEKGKHTLVLADSISAHDSVPEFEKLQFRSVEKYDHEKPEGAMLSWTSNTRIQPGRVALRDYDYEKTKATLDSLCSDPRDHTHADGEVYDWPGHYIEPSVGQDRARVQLEEIQVAYELSEGICDAASLFAGALFTLEGHPRALENREYLILSAVYDADSGTFETGSSTVRFVTHLGVLDSKVPFRPSRRTKLPLISGIQTATVVGPKSSEIWTEPYARVKLQFHWDRYGKRDENSSCWVRVAQAWAGSKWGAIFIPRIGQEVVVEFLEGNPDRPLIIGSVYNDSNKPPYDLSDNQTSSGWKTRSSKGGSANDYNEFRFEDKKGAEQITLHAQRNLAISVENDESNSVHRNLTVKVAKGHFATVVEEGFKRTEVPKNKYELSAKQIFEMAAEIIQLSVGPCEIVLDKQHLQLTAFKHTLTMDASGITLKAGSTFQVTPGGISGNGTVIKLNS